MLSIATLKKDTSTGDDRAIRIAAKRLPLVLTFPLQVSSSLISPTHPISPISPFIQRLVLVLEPSPQLTEHVDHDNQNDQLGQTYRKTAGGLIIATYAWIWSYYNLTWSLQDFSSKLRPLQPASPKSPPEQVLVLRWTPPPQDVEHTLHNDQSVNLMQACSEASFLAIW